MNITSRIRENAQEPGKHRPIVIGFLGDSVTQGCFELYKTGDTSFDTEFRSYEAYHAKLKRMLEEVFPCVSVTIINAGISGDTASGGEKRLDRDVLSFSPDLVVVCYGLNDIVRGKEGVQEYADALRRIFRKISDSGTEALFMTPNMVGERAVAEENDPFMHSMLEDVTRLQRDGIMDLYMDKAREVCNTEGVPVCDCYRKWKKLKENGADITRLLANRVNHPSEAMHWLFANSLFETIMGF